MRFKLTSDFSPTGDQPQAIKQLVEGLRRGDNVDVYLAYGDIAYRIVFFGDEIEEITSIDPISGRTIESHDSVVIYPVNIFRRCWCFHPQPYFATKLRLVVDTPIRDEVLAQRSMQTPVV